MQKQELLAPAGDIEAGYAALWYGADAVYLGLSKFSARATAANFDEAALDEFTAYAHSLQRKVYVALNTVLQENELSALIEHLDICTRCHVDGLIIQDLGVARVVHTSYPWLEMHASTQMAVHNKQGALFLQKLGFKRVVLARELTLAEIKEIAALPDLETEVFIHGALCYSYSGLCQFSAIEYGRSANRGKCLYPCRACFVHEHKAEHLFSMKDMALQQDVLKLPVTSLKIEGRKKSALYVAAVTDYYRRILDGKGADVLREENIKQIFSRPWCKFHFDGRHKDIVDRHFVGHRGLPIGVIENISHGRILFQSTHAIARHDGLQIDAANHEKPFGFSIQNMWVKNKSVYQAVAGDYVSVALPQGYPTLSKGDQIYLSSSSTVKGNYNYEKPKPHAFHHTQAIDVSVKIEQNRISACCQNNVSESVGVFEPADNPDVVSDAVKRAFSKTGDTAFCLQSLHIENPHRLFVPVSILNELRRNLYAGLKIESYHGELPSVPEFPKQNTAPRFIVKVDNLSYLEKLNIDELAEIIYLISPNSDIAALSAYPKNKIRIALPAVCRKPFVYDNIVQQLLAQNYHKWSIANYWGLNVLPIEKLDIEFDSSLYMFNTQAMAFAKSIGASRVTLSLEDTKDNVEILLTKAPLPTSLIVYQDIALFTSVGCIRNNDCAVCPKKEKWFELKNQNRTYQALSRDCQMMVFDSQPFCIISEAQDLCPTYFRADFCYCRYTPEKVAQICDDIMKKNDVKPCIKGNFSAHKI